MVENVFKSRDTPCHGCPDRYPACSDHCKKENFLCWKEEQAKIRKARRENSTLWGYSADQIRKNRRKHKHPYHGDADKY